MNDQETKTEMKTDMKETDLTNNEVTKTETMMQSTDEDQRRRICERIVGKLKEDHLRDRHDRRLDCGMDLVVMTMEEVERDVEYQCEKRKDGGNGNRKRGISKVDKATIAEAVLIVVVEAGKAFLPPGVVHQANTLLMSGMVRDAFRAIAAASQGMLGINIKKSRYWDWLAGCVGL